MKILVVDDDEFTAQALSSFLEVQNYVVEMTHDGEAAWDLVQAFDYDLILLDVILPKLDGIALCQRLRKYGYQMPVLLLTGKNSGHEKAVGLDAGADDYLVKPCDPEELVARVRALLRRSNATSMPVLEWGNLRLDPRSCEVTYDGKIIHFTPKEYAMLELFMRNPRRVFSCSAILDRVWSFDSTPGEEAVRTQIKGLRQKLKAVGVVDAIETVYGIGYRLKISDTKKRKKTAKKSAKNDLSEISKQTQQQTLAALAGVWRQFQGRVEQQIDTLLQATAAIEENKIDRDLLAQAHREAHTLGGSLGTFGLSEASGLARKIESLLDPENLKSQQLSLQPKAIKQLNLLTIALRQEVNNYNNTEISISSPTSTSSISSDEKPFLLIIEKDRQLISELFIEADVRGIRAEVATNLQTALKKIYNQIPHLILFDPSVAGTIEKGLEFLNEISVFKQPIPIIVFTSEDSLNYRVEVARKGSKVFLHKPLPANEVLEVVDRALRQNDQTSEAVILAVDDDPQTLAMLQSLLQPWGLKIVTLSEPQRFWETLEETEPDLLILDIKMPHVNGIELCQVVRNDARWGGLPILFLTAYKDIDSVNQVFNVGADDFVSKPIIGPELVARIINRLERIKLVRTLAETDPVTKLANRHKSSQEIEKFLHLSQRCRQPLCFTILDLQNFKHINNTFGYAIGDSVLREVGQTLRKSFNQEDVVARWGGGEFIICMYGVDRDRARKEIGKILESLNQQEFFAPDGNKLKVNACVGLALYPEDGTELQKLYVSAVRDLSNAKLARGSHV
ncbi:response regulator [Mastigocoleus testarum]|uniref:Transcriptional regulator n=1 Tax=Mastigocoleus testarum BC008 TaxID=371196 RepID=A0A0V7ZFP0_9CYAN|nr:response regulator [Mastigocoleus testarum]KST63176.1 transcriptional regulator [Mastigocoleus testarum BC008]KST63180.1 transcriptional regulator [Mastigocoleus testarum BC008]